MSHYGHGYTKALPVLAARSALSRTDTDLSRRGHRLILRGKDYNQAVCAVARKMLHIVWHVLNDHPIPNWEDERCMCKKLEVMLSVLPKEEIRARGFKSCSAYAKSIVGELYRNVPAWTEGQEKAREDRRLEAQARRAKKKALKRPSKKPSRPTGDPS